MRTIRSAFSLIEILVVAVILIALAAFLMPRYLAKAPVKPGTKSGGSPIGAARSVECTSNLSQIRQAYTMATTTGEDRPSSLEQLKAFGVTDAMLRCPVSKTPYQFNAATGQARCLTPGH